MKYINPNMKKIKGSHLLLVSCGYCKYPIAIYQKVGQSNLIKMYNNRIVKGNIDFSKYHGVLICPNCKEQIATRYITKMDKKEAYRLHHSAFNKKKFRIILTLTIFYYFIAVLFLTVNFTQTTIIIYYPTIGALRGAILKDYLFKMVKYYRSIFI